MVRALLIVLDSVGIGGAPDAARYGDAGADTVGHIAARCAEGRGDREGLRRGPLRLPNLAALGLGLAAQGATGRIPPGLEPPESGPRGSHGHAVETAAGKDTPSGHWEIAGLPLTEPWGHFPDLLPSFPPELTAALVAEAGLPGILGDRHASGTAIVDELGAEHLRTGKPICYTSADSVFQIAAHEETFGLQRLYDLCGIARRLCDPYRVGRVIARPFIGSAEQGFRRTGNRKDFSVAPPGPTLLDIAVGDGRAVVSVGKIGDIFAHRATGTELKPGRNGACLDAALAAMADLPEGGLVFVNLVDFDTDHGHRRDVPGYAAELEAFDARLPEIEAALQPGDLCLVTADHGNDPTWTGTEHTREQVPILAFGPGLPARALGCRESFSDIGASVARHLGLPALEYGKPW
ncbi:MULTISPECIES: phosphopentomutase [Methylobacterium]|uniref:Phosphopentomutase n=1 Tax=Methylobacterium jeotgali TaxID=381630 RepID=A0ABQ4SUH6_9HYPH|nr:MULTISPECIES: phosphopentomutase [Methylobacterium]PIU04569.1 MAG: phosphopentomutase [Methylobacterium sp. CG09_land_8_20_14_0_10_71_15]PIU13854.1 MAG: phosphopentomutase [Methylobacterium sp. CG08_land_8_20_14_0_20_71_15]GBU16185.1 phosphopentomutase [Methylobacterium sp.]GJE05881.1 Phosphopentomutase [Methylobacterium jeotgali]